MDEGLQEKIAEASRRTGLAQADIIRLCTAIGIEDLRRLNWDLAGTVSRAANPETGEDHVDENAPMAYPEPKMVAYPKRKRALRVVTKVAEEHPATRDSGGKSSPS